MSKRGLFSLILLMAAMALTVSCARKAVFGKSPVGKVVAAMTLEEKARILVSADDAIQFAAVINTDNADIARINISTLSSFPLCMP